MTDLVEATLNFSTAPLGAPPPVQQELPNYYRLLNIPPDATPRDVRDAYMRLKSAYSNDNQALYSMLDENETKRTLELIDEAYQTLEDEDRRQAYDIKLRQTQPLSSRKRAPLANHEMPQDHNPISVDPFLSAGEVSAPAPQSVRATAERSTNAEVQQAMKDLMSEAEVGDGDLLRKLREACGVSIEELQERTKILADYIRGIEENRFDRLPPPVYVRGFIRSFLKYLGVANSDRFAKAYADRFDLWKSTAKP